MATASLPSPKRILILPVWLPSFPSAICHQIGLAVAYWRRQDNAPLRGKRAGEQRRIEFAAQAELARFLVDHMAGRGELVAEPGIVEEQRDIGIAHPARRPAQQQVGELGAGALSDRAAECGRALFGV